MAIVLFQLVADVSPTRSQSRMRMQAVKPKSLT